MRRTPWLITALALCGAPTQPVAAWGHDGHALIATIAQAHLTPATRAVVARLLAQEHYTTLRQVASWADDTKTAETAHWHFVDYTDDHCHYNPPADCAADTCLIPALRAQERILADRTLPDAQREIALKYVVHLVGDAMQPLHNIADHAGGNGVAVAFEGQTTTLHDVWDTRLIRQLEAEASPSASAFTRLFTGAGGDRQHSSISYAYRLVRESSTLPVPTDIDPIAWTESACLIAHEPGLFVAGQLPLNYTQRWQPVVDGQLIVGGLHLAGVLNVLLTNG